MVRAGLPAARESLCSGASDRTQPCGKVGQADDGIIPFGARRSDGYSLCSRLKPSMIGCHPETSEIMITSICKSSGALSLAVDL